MAVVAVPYLWVLWDLWNGSVDPLRSGIVSSDFYDLQARAMLHGHLYIPNNSIGIEAFVHHGRQYTYFGLFPSLLRIPVLILTSSLDGRLTAPSILLSWLCTGLFSGLFLWRVRVLVRGSAPLGRVEATSYGVLMATILGGSVIVFLAATPFVYDEDFAWSIALTVGALFALLGVLERPSGRRVALAGLFVLAASLNRTPTGWACVIGAVLIAAWFAVNRNEVDNRRWVLPMLAVGLVPFAVSTLISMWKFGSPFGFSLENQVYTQVDAHRRYYLSTTGGKGYNLRFIPSDLLAYLGPGGLRFSSVFPFITLPAAPAKAVGGVVLEWQYRTDSLTASMPLLFLLSLAGSIAAFRRRAGSLRLLRIPLFAALIGCAGVVVWGYIAPRYLGDFMPFLIIASIVGLVDLWRRLENRRRNVRRALLGVVTALGVFGVFANVAVASTPTEQFNSTQTNGYVTAQKTISDVTGHPLLSNVEHVASIPESAPADRVAIIGNCRALYVSNGMNYSNEPEEQFEHKGWMVAEQGKGIVYNLTLSLDAPPTEVVGKMPLLTIGRDTLWIEEHRGLSTLGLSDPRAPAIGAPNVPLNPNWTYPMTLVVDPYLDRLTLTVYGRLILTGEWANGPVGAVGVVEPRPGGYPYTITLHEPTQNVGLCRSLLRELPGQAQGR